MKYYSNYVDFWRVTLDTRFKIGDEERSRSASLFSFELRLPGDLKLYLAC